MFANSTRWCAGLFVAMALLGCESPGPVVPNFYPPVAEDNASHQTTIVGDWIYCNNADCTLLSDFGGGFRLAEDGSFAELYITPRHPEDKALVIYCAATIPSETGKYSVDQDRLVTTSNLNATNATTRGGEPFVLQGDILKLLGPSPDRERVRLMRRMSPGLSQFNGDCVCHVDYCSRFPP